jgi:hypothetical protein
MFKSPDLASCAISVSTRGSPLNVKGVWRSAGHGFRSLRVREQGLSSHAPASY